MVYNKTELDDAVSDGAWKLLGLFSPKGMTPEYQRQPGTAEPRLPEMTAAALRVLGKNRKGFFLMVEGSQVDWGNHANNLQYQIGETLAFDEAVKTVLDWINTDAERREHTLLIVVPDHETGGFAINGPSPGIIRAGELVTPGWTTGHHTGTDVPIWAQGPRSSACGRALDNTDLYRVMRDALKSED